MRLVSGLVCVALLAALAAASPSGIFSTADATAALDAAAAAMHADGSFGAGIADTASVVEAFVSSGYDAKKAKAICGFAAGVAGAAGTSGAAAANAAFVLTALKCADSSKAASLVDKINAAAASSVLADVHAAARALVAMGKDASAAVTAALAAKDDDGTFKESAEAEFGSVQGAALALQTLSLAGKNGPELKAVSESFSDLIALAEGPESGDFLAMYTLADTSADPLFATGLILDAIVRIERLVESPTPCFTADTLGLFAQYIVSRKTSASAGSLAALVKGVAAVATNGRFAPTVVVLSSGSVSKASPAVRVRVTDIRGAAVAAKVTATRVVRDGASKAVLTGAELTAVAGAAGEYELAFGASNPQPGFYVFDVAALPTASGATPKPTPVSSVHLHVKVVAVVELAECELAVVQELVGSVDTKTVPCKAGATVNAPIQADASQRIRFSFKALHADTRAALAPAQVFALFTNEATGAVASFVMAKNPAGAYALDLALKAVADEFSSHTGAWKLTVVVGDAYIANPQLWDLATFALTFPAAAAGAPKPAVDAFAHKPDIRHVFRQPEKRSAEIVSLAFTAVALAPLLLLVVLFTRIGANVSNLPTGANALAALGFHGAIGAILALFGVFWLTLTMFDVLFWLLIFGLAAVVFGHRLLSTHTSFRADGALKRA